MCGLQCEGILLSVSYKELHSKAINRAKNAGKLSDSSNGSGSVMPAHLEQKTAWEANLHQRGVIAAALFVVGNKEEGYATINCEQPPLSRGEYYCSMKHLYNH